MSQTTNLTRLYVKRDVEWPANWFGGGWLMDDDGRAHAYCFTHWGLHRLALRLLTRSAKREVIELTSRRPGEPPA